MATRDQEDAEGEETARKALEANCSKEKEPRGPQNGRNSEEGQKAKRGASRGLELLGNSKERRPQRSAYGQKIKEGAKNQ